MYKNAQGHQGDVINVVIIGPSPTLTDNEETTQKPTGTDDQENMTADELENNLRNLDTVMYSAGIDNSIRSWDIQSMSCRGVLDKESDASSSEISTLIHIHGTRALITGHHDGTLYWWNTDNAANTKLPHAHSDAVTKIHHHHYNNTEILFRFVNIINL